MSSWDFDDGVRDLARALLPGEQLNRQATINEAFDQGGYIHRDAMRHQFFPWQPVTWYLDGPVAVGANVGLEYDVLHGGLLRRIRIRAKVPPSTGNCTVIVHAGDVQENASLPVGWTTNSSALLSKIAPQSVMRLDVTHAGGAEGLSVVAYYSCTGREGGEE